MNLFQRLWRFLLYDPDEMPDDPEPGPIEGAFQLGCLIVAAFAALLVGIVWLAR